MLLGPMSYVRTCLLTVVTHDAVPNVTDQRTILQVATGYTEESQEQNTSQWQIEEIGLMHTASHMPSVLERSNQKRGLKANSIDLEDDRVLRLT